ncbi:C39 family peptidase [Anaerosacchariphilus polymeriproducens]|uniref:Peptidase C39-like domain-containing protein n=1 Tax=Anaerosacchariphilus polymeriproducens TaxID=1812858 RepID=A0A371AUG2_9FIRM|nr:papain-like cysteine protease family protein [Anaerosacchariphilus polymeriproducens]RDU23198.1 hypothetical protein DWV06_10885 [Anaerosacchariphilus polymeriproducens]
MIKRFKILLGILLVSGCMVFPGHTIFASEQSTAEGLKILSYSIPEEAKKYAYEIAPSLLSTVVDNEKLYGVSINKFEDLTLGEPYTVANYGNTNDDKNTFYFPVLENDQVKLILSITKSSGKWNATIGEDISEELNDLNSNKEYILYYDDGTTYAETKDGKDALFTDSDLKSKDKAFTNKMSYEEEVQKYKNKNGKELQVSDLAEEKVQDDAIGENAIKNSKVYGGLVVQNNENNTIDLPHAAVGAYASNPFKINNSNSKLLNTDKCLVNQQDSTGRERGMCWAASVASIVRYSKGNSTLTAQDVCDYMKINYDIGGTLNDMRNALSSYGVNNYKIKNNHSTWEEINSNISNKKPIGMASNSYYNGRYSGHAVTLIGYSQQNQKYITLWNSGNQQVQTSTFGGDTADVTFNYTGMTWHWVGSLY